MTTKAGRLLCGAGVILATVAVTSVYFAPEAHAATDAWQPEASAEAFAPVARANPDLSPDEIAGGADEETTEALTSEPLGEAQQAWSPVGLVVAILLGGLDVAFNVGPTGKVGCHNPRAENPEACKAVTTGGAAALAVLFAILF